MISLNSVRPFCWFYTYYLITTRFRINNAKISRVIILLSNRTLSALKCPVYKGFQKIFLLELANKILSLYFLVLALWFYLVLYVFYYPTSIGCTERCYQFVITSLLSIKDSRNILISVNYTINLYIFITNLVDNYIIFPYRIFIICPKADPFG